MSHDPLPLTDQLYCLVAKSIICAVKTRSTPPCGVHFLMSLPAQRTTASKTILEAIGIPVEQLSAALEAALEPGEARHPASDCLPAIARRAARDARARGRGYVADEHFTLAILEGAEPAVARAFASFGVSLSAAIEKARACVDLLGRRTVSDGAILVLRRAKGIEPSAPDAVRVLISVSENLPALADALAGDLGTSLGALCREALAVQSEEGPRGEAKQSISAIVEGARINAQAEGRDRADAGDLLVAALRLAGPPLDSCLARRGAPIESVIATAERCARTWRKGR